MKLQCGWCTFRLDSVYDNAILPHSMNPQDICCPSHRRMEQVWMRPQCSKNLHNSLRRQHQVRSSYKIYLKFYKVEYSSFIIEGKRNCVQSLCLFDTIISSCRRIGKKSTYLDHMADRLKDSSFVETGCMFQEDTGSACNSVQDRSDQRDTRPHKTVQQDLLPLTHWCNNIRHSMNHLVPKDPNVNRTLPADIWCNRLQTASHPCHQMCPTTATKVQAF